MHAIFSFITLIALSLYPNERLEVSATSDCEILQQRIEANHIDLPIKPMYTVVKAGFCIPCHKSYHQALMQYKGNLVMICNKSAMKDLRITETYAKGYGAVLLIDSELCSRLVPKYGMYQVFNPCQ